MHHKWQSYDAWFLRYGVRRTCFVILGHFLLFYPTNNLQNQNFQKNEKNLRRHYHFTHVWFLRTGLWWTEFFAILDNFLLFYPTNNLENPIFEIMKKTTGDIIILQMCTTNDNHMIYGSWDMECDRQNFLSFWTIFCPFTSLTTPSIKSLKKWKNAWKYHFTKVYQKAWSYATMFLRYSTWRM